MYRLTPGHVLQFYHLKKRLSQFREPGTFIEFGSGNGMITRLLLERGWTGTCYDLNKSACENNERFNQKFLNSKSLVIKNKDFLESEVKESKVDLVISSHVIEHLEEENVIRYFDKAKKCLNSSGVIITLVPTSPKDWGIEDEVVDHKRRYCITSLQDLAKSVRMKFHHYQGLTFPLSNFLLPVSNYLVNKNEGHKNNLSNKERTIASGNRENKFKTEFPDFFRYIVNEITLFPFIILQYIFSHHPRALCGYVEFKVQ